MVKSCLAKNGSFEVQDKKLDTKERKIRGFINWFGPILRDTKIEHVKFDQCLHYKIGNTVLIINNGYLPRLLKDNSERSKTGLMIQIEDDLISVIKFCFVFLKTENKYQFEKMVDQLRNGRAEGFFNFD